MMLVDTEQQLLLLKEQGWLQNENKPPLTTVPCCHHGSQVLQPSMESAFFIIIPAMPFQSLQFVAAGLEKQQLKSCCFELSPIAYPRLWSYQLQWKVSSQNPPDPLLQAIQIAKLTKLGIEEHSNEKLLRTSSHSPTFAVSYQTIKDK